MIKDELPFNELSKEVKKYLKLADEITYTLTKVKLIKFNRFNQSASIYLSQHQF